MVRVFRQRFSSICTGAVVAALLLAVVSLPSAPVVHAAAGTISGTVFQDFNSNGVNDSAVVLGQATDIGVAGIFVRAFDANGAQVASATSGANGTYTLTITNSASSDIRVEFSIPTNDPILSAYEPSFATTTTGAAGSTWGTSVQFVSVGNTGVNFAVNVPSEYCQNNPNLATSRQCMNSATAPSLWVTQYNGGPYTTANGYSNLYNTWSSTQAALSGTTGSIHGVAWDEVSKRVISAAYVRSFAPLYEDPIGTPRPAALFTTTPNGTSASSGTGGSSTFLADLETLLPGDQFSNTTPPATGIANQGFTGYIPSNSARNLPLGPDADIHASYNGVYEEVGKAGIGDMDTDGNGNLYVVSLYTKNLYRVQLPADGSAPTAMSNVGSIVQNISCNRGSARPFGVTHWRDNLYMGVVCDGTQDYSNAAPNSNSDERNVTYSIVRYSPATAQWSTFLGPFPLYAPTVGGNFKGSPIMNVSDQSGAINQNSWRWNPWTDEFSLSWRSVWAPVYPTPMPSDLQFDRDGSVIVSMRDRTGDRMTQFLTGAMYPDGTAHDGKGGISGGDLYRICRTGSGWTSSDYVWEGGTGCSQSLNNFGAVNEFYRDDYGKSDVYHADQSAGMLEYVAGFPEVVNTAMDPNIGWTGSAWDVSANTYSSGGLSYYLNSTGNRQTSVNPGGGVIFHAYGQNTAPLQIADGSFGKIVGMGDVEALCEMAPVQIGDRLWIDTDGDGIQDAGEFPIAGVTVRLYDSAGNLISTTQTNANGQYRFSSNVIESANGGATPDASGGNITTNTAYIIKLDNPADYVSGGALYGYWMTEADATSSVATDIDNSIDSDASRTTGSLFGVNSFPSMTVSSLSAGSNNHTYDAGFVSLVGVGDTAWVDSDADGVQDSGESPLAGVVVTLFEADGVTPATRADGSSATATTDSDGRYFIDGLLPGDYRASFSPPTGYSLTASGSGVSTNDSNPDRMTRLTSVFSIGTSPTGETVADVDPSTIARFVNPTIDAGFVPSVSVGDFVWADTDRDGVQDAGESGIAGVVLGITNADGSPVVDVFGNPVTTTTTDANGKYSFASLPAGQYTVSVVSAPAGMIPTIQNVGASSADSSTGSATSSVLSTPGASDTTLDFGFVVPKVSVGDYVWFDVDRDGIQDLGEPPLSGVVLAITATDGSGVVDVFGNPVTTRTTDVDGKFSFDDLPPGQYKVSVVAPPAGFEPTVPGVGSATSDSSTGSAVSSVLTTDGARDASLDFGFWAPPAVVGSRVWNDLNTDGLQDPDEPGVAGVVLTLTTADGAPVRDVDGVLVGPTTTDAFGNYSFTNLPLGASYKVTISYPTGATPTTALAGSDRDADSSTTSAISIRMTSTRRSDLSLDFGVILPPAPKPVLPVSVCDCPPAGVAPLVVSMPVVVDQSTVTVPGRSAWLVPSKFGRASSGATWVYVKTRLWDSSTKTWSELVETKHGTWTVIRGDVRFTPARGFTGTTRVPFRMVDSSGKTALADLYVTVTDRIPSTGAPTDVFAKLASVLVIAGVVLRRRRTTT